MNDQFSAGQKLEQFVDAITEQWLIGKELRTDAVYFESAVIDVPFRISSC